MSLLRRLACWWWGHEHYSLTYPDGTGQWPPCQRCGAPQMHSHRPTKPTAGRLPCQAMWRTLTTALAALTLMACGSDGGAEAEATEPSDLPAFDVTVIEPDQLIVKTDEADPALLRAIFDQVKAEHATGDSWYVTMTCASIPSNPPLDMGRRLASGRFANTQLGLAQTGLDSTDHAVFEPTSEVCSDPV